MRTWIVATTLLVTGAASRPAAAETTPFDQGKVRLSFGLGSTGSFSNTYFVAGGNLGYFVVDGLEVGIGGDYWFGGEPSVGRVSPSVRYVLHFAPVIKPYVGVFYRHWFVGSGMSDQDTVGANGGVFWIVGHNLFIGVGAVYEYSLTDVADRDVVYPELAIAITL